MSCQEYVADYLGIEFDQYGDYIGYLFATIFVIQFGTFMMTRYVKHIKR